MSRAALYLRVSTNEQTTENQRRELMRVAELRGWDVVAVFEDAGISGAKGRDERPQFDFMLREAVRGKFDILAVWSVDRLSRKLADLLSTLAELHSANVNLYLHQQGIDTSTPSGRAMFQMMGVFAEFERAMTQERIKAGMARAAESGRLAGRPAKLGIKTRREIRQRLEKGVSPVVLAKSYGVSRSMIYRIRDGQ